MWYRRVAKGDGGGIPLPDLNKLILPTTEKFFWCYAFNCRPEKFFTLSNF